MRRTFPRVEGVPPQTKGAATDVAAEALAVEEEALGAQSLHHVHPLAAKMADVAAAKPDGAVLTRHALKKGRPQRSQVKCQVRDVQETPAGNSHYRQRSTVGVFKQPQFAH